MFNSKINSSILSTLAAAVVATGFSINPAIAGGGGGGGREDATPKSKWNYASATENGVTTTAFGRNGNGPEIVFEDQNGQLTDVRVSPDRSVPFISMTNPDGSVTTVRGDR
ncbi:MAG: hypothetical protein AAGL23_15715 [Pseudomonadota bacterium]